MSENVKFTITDPIIIEVVSFFRKRIAELGTQLTLAESVIKNSRQRDYQREVRQQKIRVTELEKAIKTAVYGTPIDKLNRDEDGLLDYPDVKKIARNLQKVLGDVK